MACNEKNVLRCVPALGRHYELGALINYEDFKVVKTLKVHKGGTQKQLASQPEVYDLSGQFLADKTRSDLDLDLPTNVKIWLKKCELNGSAAVHNDDNHYEQYVVWKFQGEQVKTWRGDLPNMGEADSEAISRASHIVSEVVCTRRAFVVFKKDGKSHDGGAKDLQSYLGSVSEGKEITDRKMQFIDTYQRCVYCDWDCSTYKSMRIKDLHRRLQNDIENTEIPMVTVSVVLEAVDGNNNPNMTISGGTHMNLTRTLYNLIDLDILGSTANRSQELLAANIRDYARKTRGEIWEMLKRSGKEEVDFKEFSTLNLDIARKWVKWEESIMSHVVDDSHASTAHNRKASTERNVETVSGQKDQSTGKECGQNVANKSTSTHTHHTNATRGSTGTVMGENYEVIQHNGKQEIRRLNPYSKTRHEKKVKVVEFGKPWPLARSHIVILLVGTTGSGKTTLINAMINYIIGVKFEDPFRYTIERVTGGTEEVICWTIHYEPRHTVPYTLTIIDTPGFQGGNAKCQWIMEAIQTLFTDRCFPHLNILGWVIQSSLARLTSEQVSGIHAIREFIGNKPEEEMLVLLLTYADSSRAQVLHATEGANIKPLATFNFNNSDLHACFLKRAATCGGTSPGGHDDDDDDEEDDDEKQMHEVFWRRREKELNSFFQTMGRRSATAAIIERVEKAYLTIKAKLDDMVRWSQKKSSRSSHHTDQHMNEYYSKIQAQINSMSRMGGFKQKNISYAQCIDKLIEAVKRDGSKNWEMHVDELKDFKAEYYQDTRI